MEEENILLNIEFNNSDIQKAVVNIVEGRKAIDSLLAANKALADQGLKNSQAYVKNQESIKALNAEVSSNSKIVQANTQAVKNNEVSIESLKAANKQLLIDRNKVSTATEEGRKKIAELNAKYDENSKIIANNSTQVEKQRFNIGNYQSALDNIVPGLGKFATGLDAAATGQKGLTTGAKAFIATGIGLIIAGVGLTLGALISYFKGSEEGQNRLNKIMAIGSAIMEQFVNVVENVGEAIFDAINDPQQAITDFGNLVKENITNRFEGMMELIPAIGKAINLLFEGEFSEAGKVAFDAVAKVTTGIEDASGKIGALIDSTSALVDAGIANGQKLADLQSKIDKDERKLVEDRAKTNLTVQKIRAEAIALEGNAKKKAIQEAIALEEGLSKREVDLAKIQLEQAALKVKANGDDKDALDALAEARAKVSQAELTAFDNTFKFKKELQALDEDELKAAEEAQKKRDEINARDAKAEEELVILKLQAQAKEIEGAQGRADKLIEIEQVKAQQLLENAQLTENERAVIVAESDAAINDILLKSKEEQKVQEQERLAQALEDYKVYVEGLINVEKEKLLQGLISQEEYDAELSDLQLAALEVQQGIKEQFGEQDIALEGGIIDAKLAQKQFEADQTAKLEKLKLDAVANTLGQVASLFNKNSIAFKALASAQTLIQTFQSAQAVFTGMTSTIPGPVGIALGIAGAIAATLSGIARVNQINSTKVPKLAEGGAFEITGRRHSQGGEDIHVGGKLVANAEAGENLVVLKRGASPLLRNLSNINRLAGGVDFYNDRQPRRFLADGGFVSRSASVSSFQNLDISDSLSKVKIFTRVTDLHRVEGQMNVANFTSELQ